MPRHAAVTSPRPSALSALLRAALRTAFAALLWASRSTGRLNLYQKEIKSALNDSSCLCNRSALTDFDFFQERAERRDLKLLNTPLHRYFIYLFRFQKVRPCDWCSYTFTLRSNRYVNRYTHILSESESNSHTRSCRSSQAGVHLWTRGTTTRTGDKNVKVKPSSSGKAAVSIHIFPQKSSVIFPGKDVLRLWALPSMFLPASRISQLG